MTNEVIFWTQLGSVLVFVVTLFVLYRVLVQAKDSTIESLRQETELLRSRLEEAREHRPDVLAQRLADRSRLLTEELERLATDQDQHAELIKKRESELRANEKELERLRHDLERAKMVLEELTCPVCGAIIVERGYASEPYEYQGRDVDIEHEWVQYECGLRIVDGVEEQACPSAGGSG